jgi:hypothetical protein
MQLTAEQELSIRRTIALRIGALKDRVTPLADDNPYRDGWNDAVGRVLEEVMGGDPLHAPNPGALTLPGAQERRTPRFSKRKNGSYAPLEDVFLPDMDDLEF